MQRNEASWSPHRCAEALMQALQLKESELCDSTVLTECISKLLTLVRHSEASDSQPQLFLPPFGRMCVTSVCRCIFAGCLTSPASDGEERLAIQPLVANGVSLLSGTLLQTGTCTQNSALLYSAIGPVNAKRLCRTLSALSLKGLGDCLFLLGSLLNDTCWRKSFAEEMQLDEVTEFIMARFGALKKVSSMYHRSSLRPMSFSRIKRLPGDVEKRRPEISDDLFAAVVDGLRCCENIFIFALDAEYGVLAPAVIASVECVISEAANCLRVLAPDDSHKDASMFRYIISSVCRCLNSTESAEQAVGCNLNDFRLFLSVCVSKMLDDRFRACICEMLAHVAACSPHSLWEYPDIEIAMALAAASNNSIAIFGSTPNLIVPMAATALRNLLQAGSWRDRCAHHPNILDGFSPEASELFTEQFHEKCPTGIIPALLIAIIDKKGRTDDGAVACLSVLLSQSRVRAALSGCAAADLTMLTGTVMRASEVIFQNRKKGGHKEIMVCIQQCMSIPLAELAVCEAPSQLETALVLLCISAARITTAIESGWVAADDGSQTWQVMEMGRAILSSAQVMRILIGTFGPSSSTAQDDGGILKASANLFIIGITASDMRTRHAWLSSLATCARAGLFGTSWQSVRQKCSGVNKDQLWSICGGGKWPPPLCIDLNLSSAIALSAMICLRDSNTAQSDANNTSNPQALLHLAYTTKAFHTELCLARQEKVHYCSWCCFVACTLSAFTIQRLEPSAEHADPKYDSELPWSAFKSSCEVFLALLMQQDCVVAKVVCLDYLHDTVSSSAIIREAICKSGCIRGLWDCFYSSHRECSSAASAVIKKIALNNDSMESTMIEIGMVHAKNSTNEASDFTDVAHMPPTDDGLNVREKSAVTGEMSDNSGCTPLVEYRSGHYPSTSDFT